VRTYLLSASNAQNPVGREGGSGSGRLPGTQFHAWHRAHLWYLTQHLEQTSQKKAAALPALEQTLQPAQAQETLELDELWSFVSTRKNKCWVWLALCRRTRQILAYVLGDRSEATCRKLWKRIPPAYRQGRVYTNFWEAYQAVVPDQQHHPVGKGSGQTNRIERWNNTLRQRLARFVRKTLSFSKCEKMHETCLLLFLHHYNRKMAPKIANNT
jgi:insertion element IS1 protein InsB